MSWRVLLPRVAMAAAIAGAALWFAFGQMRFDPAQAEVFIRDLGPWAPLAHILLFALGAVAFVPGALFSLAGGALFGPLWGAALNLGAATLGATAACLIARYAAAEWVRGRTGPRLSRIVAGVEAEGWRFVLFTRLTPIVPFNLLNYALGLTRIPLSHYVLATLLGMIPGALAFAWLGHAGREALSGDAAAIRYALLALALLSAIAFLPRLIRRLRTAPAAPQWVEAQALAERLGDGGLCLIDVRGADEFAGPLGHIDGARNIPLAELPGRLREIKAPEQSVVLVCRTDKRSSQAAILLREAGFPRVEVLRGGMESWNREGLPLAGRSAPASDERRVS